MRITLVISTLSGGGAERVTANMANYWAASGREVIILTTGYGGESSSYDLDSRVAHLHLGSPQFNSFSTDSHALAPLVGLVNRCSEPERIILARHATHILKLRQAIINTRPDAVISYIDETNILALAATLETGLKVIVTEHCDPNHNSIGAGLEMLRRRLYPHARYVVALTEESLKYFSPVAGIHGRVIPNAVTPSVFASPDGMAQPDNGKTLMAMGRLSHEKGFDLLISAFSFVAKKHAAWSLEIWGEGPQRSYLESYVKELGLAERVRMPGFTRRPFEAMRRSDLFALSSLCEGFSNVLIEAMACGLAVVSFDCPSGPRHIIRDEVDGVLVPPRNVRAMAEALDRLMGDDRERKRLAERAAEAGERFGMEKVMGMWEEVISD
jgi:GalNAc-alpha-(1->4)-GalNAc-alpha-(1->3)-diNAcBac-PP-undecaprenol alpha-1,4-N-acetyl-D-galactosaminyltransferase